MEFLESNGKAVYASIYFGLVDIREDDHEDPILTTNFVEVRDDCVQSTEEPSYRVSYSLLRVELHDIPKEILQVLLNCLARCNDRRLFRTGGNMTHNYNHECFDTLLQFLNFLSDSCCFLVVFSKACCLIFGIPDDRMYSLRTPQ